MSTTPSFIDQILANARPVSEAMAQQSRPYIPADVDLGTPARSNPGGVLRGATMKLPEVGKPAPTAADVLLSTPMQAPAVRPAPTPLGHIPDDYDLMADLPVAAPGPLEALQGRTMSVPVIVRPESLAERVLRTPMNLPAIGFGDAVKRTLAPAEPLHDRELSR
ncbi:hypothetical protein DV532_28780 (plasmid) [Pseudomonas sp. Leaf58]|uniref:hypothetical protein n=1 Tax=Pseudomonas sp. Leaf58 TaxID=1736226 RepID=UPI0006F57A1C|nr:hypothetical protein [Pseudomonas sp. Leaf58]AYG48262.1 hypothetical protein DV532_28780 [Pseudomonas sp. Leaf58]KQN62188.1 hypothetical protein ASF02_08475 [Pseudomonas sp. Leaf58]